MLVTGPLADSLVIKCSEGRSIPLFGPLVESSHRAFGKPENYALLVVWSSLGWLDTS